MTISTTTTTASTPGSIYSIAVEMARGREDSAFSSACGDRLKIIQQLALFARRDIGLAGELARLALHALTGVSSCLFWSLDRMSFLDSKMAFKAHGGFCYFVQ